MSLSIRPILVDLPTVAGMLSLSESTVQSLTRNGEFPKPRQMSDRRIGWLIREVDAWAESRPVSELLPPKNTGAKKLKESRKQDPQDSQKAA